MFTNADNWGGKYSVSIRVSRDVPAARYSLKLRKCGAYVADIL
jgi:hypothetical protein